MKKSFLTSFFIITSFFGKAQEHIPQNKDRAIYGNIGGSIAYENTMGVQIGLNTSKNKHAIKFQFMYKKDIDLVLNVFPNSDIENPNSVESLTTFSLCYGRVFDSKVFRIIPSLGVITGKEIYRGNLISPCTSGGFLSFSRTCNYYYEKTQYVGGRLGLEVMLKNSAVGISLEPYLNIYNMNRPDIGVNVSLVLGEIN